MSLKNSPIYEFFCKGMLNRHRKGIRFDDDGNVICEPKAEFGSDVEIDGKTYVNNISDIVDKNGNGAQVVTFNHHVEITGPDGFLSMDLITEDNNLKKYDSLGDLITKFNGNKRSCNCISASQDTIKFYNVISFGSTTADTKLMGRSFKGATLTGDTLTSVFGSTINVTDEVTAM